MSTAHKWPHLCLPQKNYALLLRAAVKNGHTYNKFKSTKRFVII